MKMRLACLTLLAAFALSGCVTAPPLMPGDTEQDVIEKRGAPAGRYQDGDNILLEYPGGYFGQYSYMARIGPDGRLISFEQVLTTERFATIVINQSTKLDVLKTVGRPSETSWLSLPQLEVWSYRYKESGVWNSIMHIQFDQAGIVRRMENLRDPMFEEDDFFSRNRFDGRSRGRGRR